MPTTSDDEIDSAFSETPTSKASLSAGDSEIDAAFAPSSEPAKKVSPNQSVAQLVAHEGTQALLYPVALLRHAWDVTAGGKSAAEADQRRDEFLKEHSFQITDPTARELDKVYQGVQSSPKNFLSWPGKALNYGASKIDAATGTTLGSATSDALQVAGLLAPGVKSEGPRAWARPPAGPPPVESPELVTAGAPEAAVGAKVAPPLTATGSPRAPAYEPVDAPKAFADETPAAPKPEPAASPMAVQRAKILQDIGLTRARTSALTNDGPAGMSEFQTSKDPTTPQGAEAHRIFTSERQALNNFADGIIGKIGGTAGTDASTLEARGNTILKPFDDLGDYFDKQRKLAYEAADSRSKGIPTDLKGFQDVLNDESHLTNQDRVGLKSGLSAYLKKLGVIDSNGNITASVQQAETIRKYLNDEWSPQNSKFTGKLKDALDEDVTKAAGEDIYKPARAIVAQQKNILENPKGIADVLDASGPNGINRKVPVGQVADRIVNLPPAQLAHIVKTLDEMPPELQPAAKAAKAELQSHFASRLSDVANKFDGPWNHRGVNQFMDNNSARAPILFGKDNPLLQDMNTLRAAGNILRVDRSYPGAAVQGRILQSKLLPGAIAGGGTLAGEAIGSALGAPGIGSMVGGAAGGAAALRMSQKAGVKALQKRMTKLSDLTNP